MRTLLLFRGAPGCGKSTFIEKNGLKQYALSADDIRLLCQNPALDINGNTVIAANSERTVWDTLFKILEIRMKNGDFTVIDATNSKTVEMNRYKDLAAKYRYRMYIIDMTDLPIEECKRRNASRPMLKRVPEEAIDKMYSRFKNDKIPSGIKVLKPDELNQIWYRKEDFSEYESVHVIGDIHGCYTVLKRYIENNGNLSPDNMYVFVGDYVDRGIENAETINKLKEYIKENDVSFVFECCDMKHDPHVIEYDESELFLLDVVKNQLKFEKLPYDKLVELANDIGVNVKEKAYTLNTWQEFRIWLDEVSATGWKYNGRYIEGFVIEDSKGFMLKVKLQYYKYWKRLRRVAQDTIRSGSINYTGSLLTPMENDFYGWCKMKFGLTREEKEQLPKDICTLRKMFYEDMGIKEE